MFRADSVQLHFLSLSEKGKKPTHNFLEVFAQNIFLQKRILLSRKTRCELLKLDALSSKEQEMPSKHLSELLVRSSDFLPCLEECQEEKCSAKFRVCRFLQSVEKE